ncbi:MAG: hypothetical protein Q9219_004080 [cf. Caloplaca sp. 3 TL-2023]
MPEVRRYPLSPTKLIPNSPYPLLHYPQYFARSESCNAASIHELHARNGWETQWIYRYGPTQPSHYHSKAHECMTVLSGSATIRFGVADIQASARSDTHDDDEPPESMEAGGVDLEANPGDVFLVPAGVAHKTFDPRPSSSTFALLTPGKGHGVAATDAREALANIELSGFTMLGAYPCDSAWDFSEGGEHVGEFEKVWSVPKPRLDPVMGSGKEGLCGLWSLIDLEISNDDGAAA